MRFVWVGVAGATGALTRYAIGLAVGPRTFPWATLGINVSGSFVLAFVLAYATSRHVSPEVTAAVAVGFLGAYTTFPRLTTVASEVRVWSQALTPYSDFDQDAGAVGGGGSA